MRIVFCDDEPHWLSAVGQAVEDYFALKETVIPEYARYTDGHDLLQQEQTVDIAFLDVEMPGISGIELARELKKRNPFIKIFIVTSYPDYLDAAMGEQVFRYLSKPVNVLRLQANLKEAVRQYHLDTRSYPITTEDGVTMCRAEQLICVEAAGRRVLIHTVDGVLTTKEPMEHWKTTLTLPCFYQTHRSYLVNMRFVSSIHKDKVVLKHGETILEAYLTRRRYSNFKDRFLQYIERIR